MTQFWFHSEGVSPQGIQGQSNEFFYFLKKKEPKIPNIPKISKIQEVSKININNYEIFIINKNDNIIKSEIEPYSKNNSIEYKIKKDVANNKKKITTTISGIISDSFIETNKHIPSTDTYVFNYIVEFINIK